MVIRRVTPWSFAKVMGVLQAVMGLIVGLMISLMSFIIGSGLAASSSDMHDMPFGGAAMGAIFGIGAVIFLPIVYGILGFITGAIGALIYNMVAGAIGGIEIEVDGAPVQRVG